MPGFLALSLLVFLYLSVPAPDLRVDEGATRVFL
jgi:hypothetical protein